MARTANVSASRNLSIAYKIGPGISDQKPVTAEEKAEKSIEVIKLSMMDKILS